MSVPLRTFHILLDFGFTPLTLSLFETLFSQGNNQA